MCHGSALASRPTGRVVRRRSRRGIRTRTIASLVLAPGAVRGAAGVRAPDRRQSAARTGGRGQRLGNVAAPLLHPRRPGGPGAGWLVLELESTDRVPNRGLVAVRDHGLAGIVRRLRTLGIGRRAVAPAVRRANAPGLRGSMLFVLTASAVLIELLTLRNGAVPVPHTLFYVISVALPYCWRSGLLLAPAAILGAGLLACPRPKVRAGSAIMRG